MAAAREQLDKHIPATTDAYKGEVNPGHNI
jgi:hypothetical protein